MTPGSGADSSKPLCRKAKDLRRERRRVKLSTQSANSNNFQQHAKAQSKNSLVKSLEDFINEPMPNNPAHTLEVNFVFFLHVLVKL